ncbi:MAG: hypothetical protein J5449_08095 [Oscillospiraceae bacterium]|nr:hypothetical protein [Oscillospiraceae bacterium]
MKKINWLLLAVFTCAAICLRTGQLRTGFDEMGLPIAGNLFGTALIIVLFAAAVWFALEGRKLPAASDVADGTISDCFRFKSMAAVFCAVAGAFLLPASVVASVAGYSSGLQMMLLYVSTVVSAFCLLYVVVTLYRGREVLNVTLLVPVCSLIVYLIFLYRADASDPVLARFYIEILAAALLTFSSLELAGFAFGCGSPRLFMPSAAMAALLSAVNAAQRQSLASMLLFAGCALLELGFLIAMDFTKKPRADETIRPEPEENEQI